MRRILKKKIINIKIIKSLKNIIFWIEGKKIIKNKLIKFEIKN